MKHNFHSPLPLFTATPTATLRTKVVVKKTVAFSLFFFFICTTTTTLFPIHDAFEHTFGTTKVVWSGFIKTDAWADTRQVASDRFGEYLYYPRRQDWSSTHTCCGDKNARGQYNMSLVESNIGVAITGPKIGNATPKGVIRVNFWGISEDTAYLPRMLNTYIAFDWEKDFLLLGQYEHPLAAANCFPATISYNWGAPMQAQGLQPQIRYMHRAGKCNLTACLLAQVPDINSNGPEGFTSKYLQNSMIPDAAVALEWYNNNDTLMLCGVFEIKRLRPRLVNDNGNKVDETITSVIAAAGIHYGSDDITVNSKIFYAQNGVDQTLLSGYGIATRNSCDTRTYTNLQAVSWWLDINKPINRWTPGIFMGIAKNIGAQKNLYRDPETDNYTIYSLDVDAEQIDSMFRISPRVLFTQHPFQCGAELEYTGAAFGTVQSDGTVKNTKMANNVRFMVSFYYLF
jgi:hypothetical protein